MCCRDAELLPGIEENEERAVVLFRPVNTHLLHSPSQFSVTVDSGDKSLKRP
ncbi:hypothetical protein SLEP1_g16313 [Rubroshorea leprosula]|uniref:Uncharacterized protein n=1 Tax=Rubroshorea leprosula TaxID=152421 RepID=A0AAV5J0Y0_9ROSI|nr:hypothetical protein SLEP1_g16313 [Rubroshorea leprosula]